jgi:TolB-like protein/Tfp pilus assembly protein PilF
MFTDMVGYTALGQRNESLSIALAEEQRNLVRPILVRHHGREVKTMGDAFLVEFSNALDAVRCAYDIQRASREFNISQSNDMRIRLRVGLHVGDVEESNGDIFGDAVNVASRIEPMAEDGGVCLTRQVYDNVQNKFELPLRSMGPKTLKNVSMPVEVYEMVMPWQEVEPTGSAELEGRRIAVLPFVNMSSDPQDEFFADGLTEELIDRLSQAKDLEVIARTSVMSFKKKALKAGEIGRELRAGSLVEGSVRKSGNKVRVTAQLINANTEGHLWSSKYDRDLQDIFAVQSDIAEQVAEALRIRLLPTEKMAIERKATESPEAYTLYLKGRYYWNGRTKEGLTKAITYFEQAIQKDPKYAQAYAGLGDTYGVMVNYGYIRPDEGLPKAKASALKALELGEGFAEAHSSHAVVLWNGWDFRGAGEEMKTALELNPSYARAHQWYGDYLHYVEKKPEEAMAEKLRSRDLDPLSPIANLNVGAISYQLREYDRAIGEFKKALELFPDYWNLHVWLGMTLLMTGDYDRAIKELDIALGLSGNATSVLSTLGCAYAVAGRTEEANEILSKLKSISKEQFVSPVELGYVLASLGNLEEAFSMFGKAIEEKASGLPEALLGDPLLVDRLGGDPRYEALLDRFGLGRPVVYPKGNM